MVYEVAVEIDQWVDVLIPALPGARVLIRSRPTYVRQTPTHVVGVDIHTHKDIVDIVIQDLQLFLCWISGMAADSSTTSLGHSLAVAQCQESRKRAAPRYLYLGTLPTSRVGRRLGPMFFI
jgi:hypothetical protein